ncbi:TRAP transporter substrate-binding protein [Neobacillus sp. DY30]|uniref:TRAP transporter substrate-binding protein n=1 Tax=Neobacillus sp. DY30 TaxID=3047871 RepID=UPI0024C00DE2|nr:TRAP transporter substrate-binding protein [Neobacillus sp. DY30]WHX99907.1 TRAP transporter substrate-binding protein [Neobacillus sp. DY30]
MQKKKFRFLSLIAILSAFALVLAGCASGGTSEETAGKEGATYTFKAGHVTQESHVWHQTALKFGEELDKLSNGRMKLEVYPASQLGQEKDMVQQLETGSLDFGFLTNAYMSTRQESLNAWFMPFAFRSLEEAVKLRDSEPAKEMLKELDSQGLVGLDFGFAGNRHILMKKGHIASPGDLKGKKVRIIGSPAIQDFWATTGAGPTAMPLSEVYTSLQTGVIDGIDIDLDALVTEKYYENAENLTITNHTTFPTVIVMGKTSFEKLSKEDQEIVKTAMKTAVDWGIEDALKREKDNLETLNGNGVKVEELKDTTSFDNIKKEVEKKYTEKSPTIKSFLEEAGK